MLDRKIVLPHLLAARAAEAPGDVVVQEVAGRAWTYERLHDAGLRWAAAYRQLGVAAGDTVLTLLPNGGEAFAAWLGVAWLCAIEVPVNTMYRGRMLEYIINNSGATTMVVEDRFVPALSEVAAGLEHLKTIVVVGKTDEPQIGLTVLNAPDVLQIAPADDLAGPEHYDTASMIYTSGTTGPSKGVLVPWRELYEFVVAMPDGMYTEGRGIYTVLPVFHVSGKLSLWAAAFFRARLVVREVFSLSEFWADIKRFDCTTTGLIGSMASLLFRQPPTPAEVDSPLREVAMGPMIPELAEFRERFGVRVTSGFGMTEVGAPLAIEGFDVTDWQSCGRPRPGYQVRVVDDHDEPLGPGEVGELVVRTGEPWMLNAGYWRMPDKTAEAWRNGWFHTGDAMRYDEEGTFYFVDRIKDAIRRRGENISSFEVEAYVTEHPDVLECAAIGVPAELTEDDVKIVVVPRPDSGLTHEALYDFLAPKMPRFMLPRYIEFAASLPKTPTLRVQKVQLRLDAHNPNTWDREGSVLRPSS